jgi:predicted O-methyltransferase YrrM
VSQETWDAVDAYVGEMLLADDPALTDALAASEAAGMPAIAVSPPQGKLLALLARIHHAERVLEVGTLGGYSTIWLARAIGPRGELVTLELDPGYAEVAGASIERAGLSERVQVRVGAAADSMRALISEGVAPFDLVFIDADKQGTPEYFELALALTGPGAVILTDNVVRFGALADPATEDERAQGMRRFHEVLARESAAGKVNATTIQTVGLKGYDGFTLALVER